MDVMSSLVHQKAFAGRVHEYATAREALASGRFEDALKSFSKAIDVDSNFGVAYSGMAIAAEALGQQQDAEKYIKLALGHLDRMTERERYWTRSSYYLLLGNQEKCVDEYNCEKPTRLNFCSNTTGIARRQLAHWRRTYLFLPEDRRLCFRHRIRRRHKYPCRPRFNVRLQLAVRIRSSLPLTSTRNLFRRGGCKRGFSRNDIEPLTVLAGG